MPITRGKYKKTDIKLKQLVSLLEGVQFKTLEKISAALGPQTVEQTRRQLKQLEKLGYYIEKEPGKSTARRIYQKSKQDLPLFQFDEQLTVMKALDDADMDNKLKGKVTALISSRIENSFSFYEKYQIIMEAMQKGRQVYMKTYASRDHAPTEKTCTIGHVSLEQARAWAWNARKGEYYALNLEKMSGVEVSKRKAENHPDWNQNRVETDLFGFLKIGKGFQVNLRLTDFAYSMLKRQFSHAEAREIKHLNAGFKWIFETTVYDIKPVARFVVGLFDQVMIDGDEKVKNGIKDYFENKTKAGYNQNF